MPYTPHQANYASEAMQQIIILVRDDHDAERVIVEAQFSPPPDPDPEKQTPSQRLVNRILKEIEDRAG